MGMKYIPPKRELRREKELDEGIELEDSLKELKRLKNEVSSLISHYKKDTNKKIVFSEDSPFLYSESLYIFSEDLYNKVESIGDILLKSRHKDKFEEVLGFNGVEQILNYLLKGYYLRLYDYGGGKEFRIPFPHKLDTGKDIKNFWEYSSNLVNALEFYLENASQFR